MNNLLDDVEIIKPSQDDVLSMRAMHAKSWRETYPNDEVGVSTEWVMARTEAWFNDAAMERSNERLKKVQNDDKQLELIAKCKKDNSVVGIVHGSKLDGKQHLEALYIDSLYYGSGLAQIIMQRLMDWFDLSEPIILEVASYNERAKKFYNKYGFSEVDGSEHKFDNVMPVIYMKRRANYEI